LGHCGLKVRPSFSYYKRSSVPPLRLLRLTNIFMQFAPFTSLYREAEARVLPLLFVMVLTDKYCILCIIVLQVCRIAPFPVDDMDFILLTRQLLCLLLSSIPSCCLRFLSHRHSMPSVGFESMAGAPAVPPPILTLEYLNTPSTTPVSPGAHPLNVQVLSRILKIKFQ
jgi:hypothetical protein